jgi:hypothetical protein
MKIDVISTCGPQGDLFIRSLIDNVAKTTSVCQFEFILAQYKCDISQLSSYPNVRCVVKVPDIPKSDHDSNISHGTCLNACLPYVETDLVLIVDCDVLFLTPAWDARIIEQFANNNLGLIGTEYSDKARGLPKYLNYPTAVMLIARTDILRKYAIDFRPDLSVPIHVSTAQEALAYGRPRGSQVFRDVGYELCTKLRPACVQCQTLKFIGDTFETKTRQYIGQKFANEYMAINHMKCGSSKTPEVIKHWQDVVGKAIT